MTVSFSSQTSHYFLSTDQLETHNVVFSVHKCPYIFIIANPSSYSQHIWRNLLLYETKTDQLLAALRKDLHYHLS